MAALLKIFLLVTLLSFSNVTCCLTLENNLFVMSLPALTKSASDFEGPFSHSAPLKMHLNSPFFLQNRVYLFFPNKPTDHTFLLHMFLESVTFRDDSDYQLKMVPLAKNNLYTFASFPKNRFDEVQKIAKLFKQTLVPFEQTIELKDSEGDKTKLQIHFSKKKNLLIAKGDELEAHTVLSSILKN